MTLNRRKIAFITFPLSLIYGFIVSIRNILFDLKILKSTEFGIPVISVGNITVGGTGKTPHIEYIIKLLSDQFNIAVLSRGYKRKTRNFILATPESDIIDIGDEPKQLKQKFPDIHIAVDRKRVHGIYRLLESVKDLKVILLDDAYQHRYIKPGLSILLIDFNQPLSSDHMLPFGNLRESKHEIRRTDIVIITKTPKALKPIERKILIKELKILPSQFLYFTTYEYMNPEPVFTDNKKSLVLTDIKNTRSSILMVTGIAQSAPLVKFLKSFSKTIDMMKFPDHHFYTSEDLIRIKVRFTRLNGKIKYIFTTEKDTVRFRELQISDNELKLCMYFVPIEVKFLYGGAKKFNNDIISYVKKNKRIDRLYK
jgi:tetraacyldisaccharide 4'-kinase